MGDNERGFSMLELLAALLIMGIIAAFALPMAITAVKTFRVNADATALASYLNLTRSRATSQYAPYRLNVDPTQGDYTMEKLCGNTSSSVDPACTGPYQQFTTRQFEYGTQYPRQGDYLSTCAPSGVTSAPTGFADPSPCPAILQMYFNTRGTPVKSDGSPLGGGGYVAYIQNQNTSFTDAVTVSVGGRVSMWNWSPTAGWSIR